MIKIKDINTWIILHYLYEKQWYYEKLEILRENSPLKKELDEFDLKDSLEDFHREENLDDFDIREALDFFDTYELIRFSIIPEALIDKITHVLKQREEITSSIFEIERILTAINKKMLEENTSVVKAHEHYINEKVFHIYSRKQKDLSIALKKVNKHIEEKLKEAIDVYVKNFIDQKIKEAIDDNQDEVVDTFFNSRIKKLVEMSRQSYAMNEKKNFSYKLDRTAIEESLYIINPSYAINYLFNKKNLTYLMAQIKVPRKINLLIKDALRPKILDLLLSLRKDTSFFLTPYIERLCEYLINMEQWNNSPFSKEIKKEQLEEDLINTIDFELSSLQKEDIEKIVTELNRLKLEFLFNACSSPEFVFNHFIEKNIIHVYINNLLYKNITQERLRDKEREHNFFFIQKVLDEIPYNSSIQYNEQKDMISGFNLLDNTIEWIKTHKKIESRIIPTQRDIEKTIEGMRFFIQEKFKKAHERIFVLEKQTGHSIKTSHKIDYLKRLEMEDFFKEINSLNLLHKKQEEKLHHFNAFNAIDKRQAYNTLKKTILEINMLLTIPLRPILSSKSITHTKEKSLLEKEQFLKERKKNLPSLSIKKKYDQTTKMGKSFTN